ncbi:hypothetical protein CR513_52624, partial [Mucuna pruriens]
MVTMFIDTPLSPYYEKVMGSVTSNFTDLVVVGKRIELGIRRGKLAQANSNMGFTKKLLLKKKKGEANGVLIEPVFPHGKGTTPLYPVQFHVRVRSTVAHSPPMPIIPPYQPRTNIGVSITPRADCLVDSLDLAFKLRESSTQWKARYLHPRPWWTSKGNPNHPKALTLHPQPSSYPKGRTSNGKSNIVLCHTQPSRTTSTLIAPS